MPAVSEPHHPAHPPTFIGNYWLFGVILLLCWALFIFRRPVATRGTSISSLEAQEIAEIPSKTLPQMSLSQQGPSPQRLTPPLSSAGPQSDSALEQPPRRRSYTKATAAGSAVSGGVIQSAEGWRRHTKVFGGGVCEACAESERQMTAFKMNMI